MTNRDEKVLKAARLREDIDGMNQKIARIERAIASRRARLREIEAELQHGGTRNSGRCRYNGR